MASTVLSLPPAVFAAEAAQTIYISTAEDFIKFAQNCTLDTWSQGKTVILNTDISLLDTEISTIPTFGGTFDGNGHTIRDLSITQSMAPAGLFYTLQKDAVVSDLTVIGNVVPSGDSDTLGGIAGVNYGKLIGCTFHGFVSGNSRVGGIVGLNEATGQLINCSFEGTITGEHYVGGIVGWNAGSLIQCTNNGSINTTVIDVKTELSDLNMESLRSTEAMPAGTDIGGIAGFSTGLLQSCNNTGDVGYEHMGYNVGGIVGRQMGYLDGCINTGTILGRKDVGGIAGQLEPQVTLKYNEDTLDSLWDELDVLEDLMDRALGDAQDASDAISGSMNDLTDSVGTAKDSAVDLTDAMTKWANGNIDQVNDISARISWVLSQMEPILDDLGAAMEQAETATGQFSDALDDAELAAKWGNEAMTAMETAMADLQNAFSHAKNAYAHIKDAMTHMENSLGNTSQTKSAMKELAAATADMASAFSGMASAMSGISQVLDDIYDASQSSDENWTNLRDGTDELRAALVKISSALTKVSGALDDIRGEMESEPNETEDDPNNPDKKSNIELLKDVMNYLKDASEDLNTAYTHFSTALNDYVESELHVWTDEMTGEVEAGLTALDNAQTKIATASGIIGYVIDDMDPENNEVTSRAAIQLREGLDELNTGISEANTAIKKIDGALQGIEDDPRYESTVNKIRSYLNNISTELNHLSTASSRLSNAMKTLNNNLNPDQAEEAWKKLKLAGDDLDLAATDLDKSVSSLKLATQRLEKAGEAIANAMSDLNKASETMGKTISSLRNATEKIEDVITELAEKPAIQFTPINSDLTERGDALDDALSQVLDGVNSLNDSMATSSEILLTDLRAINRQVGVIIDLLRQASEESDAENSSERYEDISDQELSDDQTSGRISASRNSGEVEGDINVAGIVGSIAIEYDYDPEDDLNKEGGRSLDYRFQTAAGVWDCVNAGAITAKKDCAGGIVGRMDLGTVCTNQSYGIVESTSGDYVGGIAGLTSGTVRKNYVKCTLVGGNYVGGVAGSGSDAQSGDRDSTISDCYSMVNITRADQYSGAVAGIDAGNFTDNYFVSDTLSGINGISYSGKAEPIAYADLPWDDTDIPIAFGQLTLQFVVDDTPVKTVTFTYGDSFDETVYPEIPKKDGNYSYWDQEELKDLHFDTVVTAVYTPYITALSSSENRSGDRPVFFVEGLFDDDATLEETALSNISEDALKKSFSGRTGGQKIVEQWELSVSNDEQETHTVRYLPPEEDTDPEDLMIYVKDSSGWKKAETEMIGSYLLFPINELNVQVAIVSATTRWLVWLLVGAALLLLLVLLAYLIRKKHKRKKKNSVKDEAKNTEIETGIETETGVIYGSQEP